MWKELVAAGSVMVSEGKTMASDGMEVDSGKGWCRGARKGTLGFRQREDRGRVKMRVVLALNRATSRLSREESSQHRDFPESCKNQRRDVPGKCKTNVATLRSNVTTLRSNVATFQRRV